LVRDVRSGIPGLDDLMKIPQEACLLVIGGESTAMSIILRQFLYEGLRTGEPGIYVAIDEIPQRVRDAMKGLGWDLAPHEGKTFEFVDCHTGWLRHLGIERLLEKENFVVSDPWSVDEIYETIVNAQRKVGRGRIVFDSISGILTRASIEAGLEPPLCTIMDRNYRQLAVGVVHVWADSKVGTSRVLAVDPTVVSEDIIHFLESQANIVIRLIMAEKLGKLARQLRLERWERRRGRPTPIQMTKWAYFEITDRGIAILG